MYFIVANEVNKLKGTARVIDTVDGVVEDFSYSSLTGLVRKGVLIDGVTPRGGAPVVCKLHTTNFIPLFSKVTPNASNLRKEIEHDADYAIRLLRTSILKTESGKSIYDYIVNTIRTSGSEGFINESLKAVYTRVVIEYVTNYSEKRFSDEQMLNWIKNCNKDGILCTPMR